jgi:hypothetical protein
MTLHKPVQNELNTLVKILLKDARLRELYSMARDAS